MQRWLMDTVYSSVLTECEEGRDGWPLPAQKGKCTIKIRAYQYPAVAAANGYEEAVISNRRSL